MGARNAVIGSGLAALLAISQAAGQDAERPGRLVTRSFAPISTPFTVMIELQDNTEENVALGRRFAEEIAKRGGNVKDSGALLGFYIVTEVRPNVVPSPAAPARPSSQERGAPAAEADPARSTQLPPPTPPNDAAQAPPLRTLPGRAQQRSDYSRSLRYVINVTIDDKRDGKRLWQGHVSYDGAEPDRKAIFSALAPLLAAEIGKTVQERRFTVD